MNNKDESVLILVVHSLFPIYGCINACYLNVTG